MQEPALSTEEIEEYEVTDNFEPADSTPPTAPVEQGRVIENITIFSTDDDASSLSSSSVISEKDDTEAKDTDGEEEVWEREKPEIPVRK